MKISSRTISNRDRRHRRIRAKISGTADMPRLCVYKSNRYVTAQIIDDEKGATLIAGSTQNAKGKGMIEKSRSAGKALAEAAVKLKIKKVAFDRGGFIYTGRVKAFAEGAREGGLQF
ncbi:50S ribosomal protein L18 [Candidatus Parcubacteria bacterium]|nr:50S ribosomal protein L18 [Candidatus Parcubacteria bacterium]